MDPVFNDTPDLFQPVSGSLKITPPHFTSTPSTPSPPDLSAAPAQGGAPAPWPVAPPAAGPAAAGP